ncbi:MAG: T9SS type A sorting domain-containing protein [Paludibacteraceae bacterium]|nr:T9SS type A sorting domain-containing protein [Paludibacteraceae bacterium]
MRKKYFISTVAIATLFASNVLADNTMRIEYMSSEEYKEKVSAIARWEIDGANERFRLIGIDGTLLAERNLYDDIKQIVFYDDNGSTVELENVSDHSVTIFPNPTKEILHINGIKQGEVIRIFSLNGNVIVNEKTENETLTLSVATLPNGIYLLQIGTEIVKFIKE